MSRKEQEMTTEIAMRWVALAPLVLVAITMFAAWQ